MSFQQSIKACLFDRYADFSGRATRAEFWYFYLFSSILTICALVLDAAMSFYAGHREMISPIYLIITIILFLPSLAVAVRRFHDIDKSGWWYLFNLIPFIGWAFFIMWMCTPGTAGRNDYGENPYGSLGSSGGKAPQLIVRGQESRTTLSRGWLISTVLPSGVVLRRDLPSAGSITVGRGKDVDFQIDDKSVSRLHAAVETRGARIYVSDLGSTNGTFLGRTKVSAEPTPWNEGDTLQLGSVNLSLSRS